MSTPAIRLSLSDIVAEYNAKHTAAEDAIEAFKAAQSAISAAAAVGTSYGGLTSRDSYSPSEIRRALLKSAWKHVHAGLNIRMIAGDAERRRLDMVLEKPPAFTLANIRDVFGDYLIRPRHHILKGLCEVFSDLDPAFRSHEKVKIGVKGLPKRVIVSGFSGWRGYGLDRVQSIINAMRVYEGRPMFGAADAQAFAKLDEAAQREVHGVWLRTFANGNGHLFFGPEALATVNRALGEWYGDVLPDTPDENPNRRASTAVSKDLQYYPTPAAVVDRVMGMVNIRPGDRVLEPSCGCGRFLDAIRRAGGDALGVEVDPIRQALCHARGHDVALANFLEVPPSPTFDHVVMNPPFYGRHYAKHVAHALRFLKPGGRLTAILPSTARYDHGELTGGSWSDLPPGSFSESGTNVNVSVFQQWAAREQRTAA